MKFRGGYTPKISGRPLSTVEESPFPERLFVSLERGGLSYVPVVRAGQKVGFGDPLAEVKVDGGTLQLPSPASGKVAKTGEINQTIILEELSPDTATSRFKAYRPERITDADTREVLSKAGIWPFFWSSRTGGLPALSESEKPKAIVMNCVLAEPFRARGRVIIRRSWSRIMQGIRFLPRLLADYGRVEIILTHVHDPVARQMYADLAGYAWVRLHPVPVTYPIENPLILIKILRKAVPFFKAGDTIWLIDVQGIEALGACLAEGMPLHQRVVTTGGPGAASPKHHSVRVGSPVSLLSPKKGDLEKVHILRGGLLKGVPLDSGADGVQYDDDAFFYLPEVSTRQFLGFLRPGFDRTCYAPCFATRLTGGADRHISILLRGERRPCIACGLCEKICPAQIMPQILHRYLYRDALEEAEKAGLERCVDCDLCTYVCPSKIELQKQFSETRQRLRMERGEEGEAVSSAQAGTSFPGESKG